MQVRRSRPTATTGVGERLAVSEAPPLTGSAVRRMTGVMSG
jgi:hypothetical protein